MPADCFGVEITDAEIARWNTLDTGPHGFSIRREPLTPLPPLLVTAQSAAEAAEFARWWTPLEIEGGLCVEFGCGAGRNVPHLLHFADQYVGLDISSLVIAVARYLYQRWSNARFYHTVHDAAEIVEGLAGQVQTICGVNFFYHQPLERLTGMVDMASRMLAPGGQMLIDQVSDELDLPSRTPADWQGPDPVHWPGYRVPDALIAELASRHGFAIERKSMVVEPATDDPYRDYYILRKLKDTPRAGRSRFPSSATPQLPAVRAAIEGSNA